MTSHLEQKFDDLWTELYPDIDLEAEVRIIPNRRFRHDYIHKKSKVAIEINGGTYIRGRHTRGKALENEYTKVMLAAKQGYLTLFLSANQITEDYLKEIKQIILDRCCHCI